MRPFPVLAAGLAGVLLTVGFAPAEEKRPPVAESPRRFIPADVDLCLEAPDPTRLADLLGKLEILTQAQKLPFVKEQLDSTSVRRARQLLAYFERTLGAKWPTLLDSLAGGGVALGARYGNNGPALLVVQGRDEKRSEQFLKHLAVVLEGELARQDSKDKLTWGEYNGVSGFKVGNALWMARVGPTLLAANRKEALSRALDLHFGKAKASLATSAPLKEADALLPAAPLARAWFNLKPLHTAPGTKDLYQSPRDNGVLTVLVGSYLDVIGRSPWVGVGLYQQKGDFLLTVRMPRGREGLGEDRHLHVPPDGKPTTRPVLEPKNVLYTSSFRLDVSRIWTDRAKLFPKAQAEGLTRADGNSGRALAGAKLSALLQAAGANHRLVVVSQPKPGYKRAPQQILPAFAFIPELRQPEKFARSMDTVLRGLALLATPQFKLTLHESKHRGVDLVGYRFDEKATVKQDVTDIRFNFSPCFARVGDQFVFCSTMELGRELIDLLEAEKATGQVRRVPSEDRFLATGAADLLKAFEDSLVTQTILDQAVPAGQAREQVLALIQLVRGLGSVGSTVRFDDKTFRYEIRTRSSK